MTLASLCTTICLQWEPEIVAIAVMFLAGKLNHKSNSEAGHDIANLCWWNSHVENVTTEILEDICHQILDLYSMPSTTQSATVSPSQQLEQINATAASIAQADALIMAPTTSSSMMDTSELEKGHLDPEVRNDLVSFRF